MKLHTKLGALAACAVLPGLVGCAGARTNLVAPTAQYPISLSRGVRDTDGTLVPAERRKIVGHFKTKRKAWAMLYSFLSLTPSKDLSDDLNQQIKARHGDAIINLTVASATCGMNFVFLFDWLPIWPGCSNIEITGDIIQVLPAVASAAPVPAPAPAPAPAPTPNVTAPPPANTAAPGAATPAPTSASTATDPSHANDAAALAAAPSPATGSTTSGATR